MRFGLHGQTRRVWASRGVKIIQPRQFEFDYRYLLLGVNSCTGAIQWDWTTSMKSDELARKLKTWTVDGIIWDGATSHHAQPVKQLDCALIYQPPYSPELNPVERLFQEIRRDIEGHIYDTLDDKQAVIEQILSHWQAHPEIVQSIAGWDWICDAINQLPYVA